MGFNRLKNLVASVIGYGALIASSRGATYPAGHRFSGRLLRRMVKSHRADLLSAHPIA